MFLKKQLLKLAGKDNFELDKNISMTYIIRLCRQYGWMAFRGWIISITHKSIDKNIFIGKNVKIYEKKSVMIGKKTKIHEHTKIDALSKNGVVIKDHVVIGKNTVIECTGSLSYIGKGLKIGARTTFGNDCFFGAAGGIDIGEDVVGGQYIRFHSENHKYRDLKTLIKDQGVTHKGIKIANNCWIGSGAVFLDGAELGEGCIVAANAVVTKKFSKNIILGGVPAKKIGIRC